MSVAVEGVVLGIGTAFWLGLLIELLLKGSLVLAAGLAVTYLARRRSAAFRSLVWTLVFVAIATGPWLALGRGVGIAVVPQRLVDHGFRMRLTDRAGGAEATELGRPSHREHGQPVAGLPHWSRLAIWVWLAGVVVLLAHLLRALVAGCLSLAATRPPRQGEPGGPGGFPAPRLASGRRVEIRLGETEAVPFVIGFWHPILVLPARAARWQPPALRAALLHELAHIERGDYCRLALVRLVCAVCWFNPLVWLAARRAALAIEIACDDRVVAAGTRSVDYARQLLDEAARINQSALPCHALAAMAATNLEERMTMILDHRTIRQPLSPSATAAVVGIAMLTVLPLVAAPLIDRVENPAPTTVGAPADPPPAAAPAERATAAADPQPAATEGARIAIKDGVLASELDQLLGHLRRGEKRDGRIHADLPDELAGSIVERIFALLPASEGRVEMVIVTANDIRMKISVYREGSECTPARDIALKIRDDDGKGVSYSLTLRCEGS